LPSITTIPISQLKFDDDLPTLQAVEERLTKTLRTIRTGLVERAEPVGSDRIDNSPSYSDQIRDTDQAKIKRRATLYLVRAHTATGTYHLADKDNVKLAPLRDGLPVARVQIEHEADEIAASLHAEMPWMDLATEEVWHGLRASVRDGRPGLRFNPLVLVGAPGMGKSHWARRLAEHLTVPMTKIDASNEPATFFLVGVQRGWGSAAPGKLMATVLRERHAGPLVIIDAGKIKPAGLQLFHARSDKKGYTSQSRNLLLDPAFEAQLMADETAWAFFTNLTTSYKRESIWWVMSAKREGTRQKRFSILLASSHDGLTIPSLRK
jgi:hypothetical protein